MRKDLLILTRIRNSRRTSISKKLRITFSRASQNPHGISGIGEDSGDGKNVPDKDDVTRWNIDFRSQEIATSRAQTRLVFNHCSLVLFIKCHHNQSCTVHLHHLRLSQEIGLDRLHRDGIHDVYALDIFQTLFNHKQRRRSTKKGNLPSFGSATHIRMKRPTPVCQSIKSK